MADYYSQAVVQPTIPAGCMTPLERWLLTQMFEHEEEVDGSLYLYTGESLNMYAWFDDVPGSRDLMLADTSPLGQKVKALYEAQKYRGDSTEPDDIDLSQLPYVEIFQGMIQRHPDKLPWVSIETAHTCSRPRPDGFGGHAEFITAGTYEYVNTSVWIGEQLAKIAK